MILGLVFLLLFLNLNVFPCTGRTTLSPKVTNLRSALVIRGGFGGGSAYIDTSDRDTEELEETGSTVAALLISGSPKHSLKLNGVYQQTGKPTKEDSLTSAPYLLA